MKKRGIISAVAVILVTIVLILTINSIKNNERTDISSEEKSIYTLRFYEEDVVLFKDNEIIEKYDDVNIDILPYEDRQMLIEGIVVSSLAEAHGLIEDYDG